MPFNQQWSKTTVYSLFLSSILILMWLFVATFNQMTTVASETANVPYTVEAELPDNQAKAVSYFYLKVAPAQKQTIYLRITNHAANKIRLKLEANTAITNQNGVIDYATTSPALDESLLHSFHELTKVDSEVTLAAQESKRVPIKITIPEESFNGMILGGIHIQQVVKEDDKINSSIQVRNRFAHVVGVALIEEEEKVTPELKLHQVTTENRNEHPVVSANLQNDQPVPLENLTISTKIMQEKDQKVIQSYQKDRLKMAPNSNFDFAIPVGDKALVAGVYRLLMEVESGEKVWNFEKKFTISEKQRKNVEKAAWAEASAPKKSYYIIGILLLLCLLFAAFYLGKSSRKEH